MTEYILVALMLLGFVVCVVADIISPPHRPARAEISDALSAAWPVFLEKQYGDARRIASAFDVTADEAEGWLAGEAPSPDAVAYAMIVNGRALRFTMWESR